MTGETPVNTVKKQPVGVPFKKGQSGNPNGRPKGSGNKFTKDISEILEDNQSPLEYMLSVMNNTDNDQRERLDAAKAAAPYIHARIAYLEVSAEIDQPQYVVSAEPMSCEEWGEKYGAKSSD
jgi:hypothetical protein